MKALKLSTTANRYVLTLAISLSISFLCHAQTDFDSIKATIESGDYKTALEQLVPLAEAGNAKSQNYLGNMYAKGLGVKQDYSEALKWYQKAAEQGPAARQRRRHGKT